MVADASDAGQWREMVAETPGLSPAKVSGCPPPHCFFNPQVFLGVFCYHEGMNEKTQTYHEPFPRRPLRELFEVIDVEQAQVERGDVLVCWEVRDHSVSLSILNQESKIQALENISAGKKEGQPPPKYRYSALRKTGDLSSDFLVSWARIPNHAKHLANTSQMEGMFYLNAKHRTKGMLSASIPCPTPEQEKELELFNSLTQSYSEVIANKRKMLELQEKMFFAVQSQILSGKIGKDQVKEYYRQIMGPDLRAVERARELEQKSEDKRKNNPAP